MGILENFDHAIAFVFDSEGGLNRDVTDRGGLTKFGISKKSYPNLDIESLTMTMAKEIYYRDYWVKQRCHEFTKEVSTILLDTSINCGRTNAGRWIQEASNQACTLNSHILEVDGAIGIKTTTASIFVEPQKLVYGIAGRRAKHYSALIKKYPLQVKYIRGWNNRLGDLLMYL